MIRARGAGFPSGPSEFPRLLLEQLLHHLRHLLRYRAVGGVVVAADDAFFVRHRESGAVKDAPPDVGADLEALGAEFDDLVAVAVVIVMAALALRPVTPEVAGRATYVPNRPRPLNFRHEVRDVQMDSA